MTSGSGPLAGVRVIEMAGIGPAPFATMSLADMGADVIRVERPGGAEMSTAPPERDVLNRGKRSLALDVKHPDGHAAVLALVDTADVLVEGYRPGVMERLGLGPEVLLERNPRLVVVRMTGWGQDGPLATTAGHEINYLAITGMLGALGSAGGPPQVPLPLVGDYGGGGAYAVIGVLGALFEASRTGRGQVVDVGMVDGVSHLMAATWSMLGAGRWNDARGTNLLDGGCPFYNVYETADGQWMSVGALEARFFTTLLTELGIGPDRFDPSSQYDEACWPQLAELLAAAFRTRTRDAWAGHFASSDACVAPVLGLRESGRHRHMVARGAILDEGQMIQPGLAPRFSATVGDVPGRPPMPGEHTGEVLEEIGLSTEALLASGAAAVVASDPAV
jgi:alpha-methylacyl-CoA racemase